MPEIGVSFSNLVHSFNDGKYRKIKYSIEAISKFKKYFPEHIKDFSVTGLSEEVEILSSQRPPPVEIDRVVPLIRWDGQLIKDRRRKRICDTIRIYFKGDWFQTGDGESVAIIFANQPVQPSDKTPLIPSSGEVPKELENAISQFGLDPAISYEAQKMDMFLINSDFFARPG